MVVGAGDAVVGAAVLGGAVLARAVTWHAQHRVLVNGHKTVVFR